MSGETIRFRSPDERRAILARYADVGVSHIVLEAPLRGLDDHLSLMRRFTEDIRPLTEAG